MTIHEKATLGAQVGPPVTTIVGLSSNGTPGFPLTPAAGNAYAVHVQMTASGGAGVFCIDLVVPLKTATPFASVQQALGVPMLSQAGMLMLAVALVGTGLFAIPRPTGVI